MPHVWGITIGLGLNVFPGIIILMVVVNTGHGKSARGEHPSGVVCGFCS